MRAVTVREHGGVEVLRLEYVPDKLPGPGEVAVAVKACAINHLDLWVRQGVPGYTFPLPLILGNDVAGLVLATGEGVHDILPGASVVISPGVSCGACPRCFAGRDHECSRYSILGEHRDGGYAETLVVPRANALLKPDNLSFVDAAALGVAFLTAWNMLVHRASLCPGEVVLIQAAGSGVGSAAIQIAKMWHATVVAVASTEAKLQAAKALGADQVIHSGQEDIAKKFRTLYPSGADVVIEHVGAVTWPASMRALARQGRLVTCGATSGAQVDLNLRHVFFKSLSILGATMGSKADFTTIVAHAAAGRLRPIVHQVLPLDEVRAAHALLMSRQVFGKLVLTP